MRRNVWITFAIVSLAPLAVAAPVCCGMFGIDATSMLGADPAVCGEVPDADTTAEAGEARRRATQCALLAQDQGRAFVYTYRQLVEPDIDLVVQAVFGAHGERLLLKLGTFFGQNIRSIEHCTKLTVQSDGRLDGEACSEAQPRAAPYP